MTTKTDWLKFIRYAQLIENRHKRVPRFYLGGACWSYTASSVAQACGETGMTERLDALIEPLVDSGSFLYDCVVCVGGVPQNGREFRSVGALDCVDGKRHHVVLEGSGTLTFYGKDPIAWVADDTQFPVFSLDRDTTQRACVTSFLDRNVHLVLTTGHDRRFDYYNQPRG